MKCQVIINRQKAAFNRKNKHMPEEATISIHSGGKVEYAYAVRLLGDDWILKQDYANSPCSGAHIWLEGERENLQITHVIPLTDAQDAPPSEKKALDFF